ncbi:MAG: tetratricopeptide repeat protein [Streptosporangiaceae bacterium]|nr:tetratricopeptide repeat protein [Streptosporangiaceae bacterium]
MQLRILGPLELVADGQQIKIGGPREQVVLATLALGANRVVLVEQLIDAVWDADPPPTARSQVQSSISALRKVLERAGLPDAIETRPAGYLLRISAEDLDSEQFAKLVREARALADSDNAAEAASTMRTALDLWRGTALANLSSDVVQRGATALEEARLAAIKERMQLDLDLGRHREITGELIALVSEYPLNEWLYGFLMIAHYRSGRQGEALKVYRQVRAVLQDELGVEPGQELRDLEQAVLKQDRILDPPAIAAAPTRADEKHEASPRQLPRSIADFIGREEQLAAIKHMLSALERPDAARYAVPIIAISGAGGVGKSTLALRAAHEVSDDYPDGHLYADLSSPAGDHDTTVLQARFLRALGVDGSMIPEDPAERAQMYRSRLANKQLLIVLDGVDHEGQVIPLLPGSPSCAVIVTSRVRLSGLPGAHWIDVDVFGNDASMELLAHIAGAERLAAEPAAAEELMRYCGGLPLALRIAGTRLAVRPHWRVADLARRLRDERRRLDELSHHGLELRSSIGLTYKGLPGRTKRLFRLLASIRAPDFPAWTAAALLDTDLTTAEELLEQLIDTQMLNPVRSPTGNIRYRFHELIRLYASERLIETDSQEERRGALARVVGGWLALAETAHRKEYGGDYTVLHGTAPRWHLAESADGQADGSPLDWLENERMVLVCAVRQAAMAGLDELCWDLALTLVNLFEVKGYIDDWCETAEIAYRVTTKAGNRTGWAAMEYSLGSLHLFQKRLAEAEQFFASALEAFEAEGNVHGQALVLRNWAVVDRLHGHFVEMLSKNESALAKMRAVGDLIGEANILRNLAKFQIEEGGDIAEAARRLEQGLALCRQADYPRCEAQMMAQYAELYLCAGDALLARQALHQVLRRVREIGDRMGEAHALYGLGRVRYREGRLDSAEATLTHAITLAQRLGNRFIEGQARFALGEISLARGNGTAAAAHLLEARAAFAELRSPLWLGRTLLLLLEAQESSGQPAVTGKHFDEAIALLSRLDSEQAARLVAELEAARSWGDRPALRG